MHPGYYDRGNTWLKQLKLHWLNWNFNISTDQNLIHKGSSAHILSGHILKEFSNVIVDQYVIISLYCSIGNFSWDCISKWQLILLCAYRRILCRANYGELVSLTPIWGNSDWPYLTIHGSPFFWSYKPSSFGGSLIFG